jgi:hypothetical protein
MSDHDLSLDERRSRLERRANVIRSRLLRRIDALDVRRHQVTQIGHEAKRLAIPAAAIVGGILVVAAGLTFAIKGALRWRRSRSFSYRLGKAFEPLRQEPRPSIFSEALRKATMTAVGIVAAELARRGTKNAFDGRLPGGRLASGHDGQSHETNELTTHVAATIAR